jgi:hypothetical protein
VIKFYSYHCTKLLIAFSSRNELQPIDKEVRDVQETHDNRSDSKEPMLFETLAMHLNQNQKEVLRKEYEQQGNNLIV